jgi:hypothetical protein
MTAAAPNPLRQPLPLPPFGQATRLNAGGIQLVLEGVRGGLRLLSHDGLQARTHHLAVPEGGALAVVPASPEHPLRVQVSEPLAVGPGSRLRGYVHVPLPYRILWVRGDGFEESLLELPSSELRTAWLGEGPGGGYAHMAASAFSIGLNGSIPARGVVVPVVLCNRGLRTWQPAELALRLRDRDLRFLRGRVIASPRRMVWQDGRCEELLRPFPRRDA